MKHLKAALAALGSAALLAFSIAPAQAQDWVDIRSVYSGLCLDALEKYSGGRMIVYTCHEKENQKFSFVGRTIVVKETGFCLSGETYERRGVAGYIQVHASRCHGGAYQNWTRDSSGRLINEASGKCLSPGERPREQVQMRHCTEPYFGFDPAQYPRYLSWGSGLTAGKWVRLDKVQTIAVSGGINDVALGVAWFSGKLVETAAAIGIDAALQSVGFTVQAGDTIMGVVAFGANVALAGGGFLQESDIANEFGAGDLGTTFEGGLRGLDSIFAGPDDLYITVWAGRYDHDPRGKREKIWPVGRSSVDAKPGDVFKIGLEYPLRMEVEYTLFDKDTIGSDNLGGLRISSETPPGTYMATVGREDEKALYQLTYTVFEAP